MLDIILQILPVLGIILLILLCIMILFLLLVLFFPVSYKISGKKDAEAFSLTAGADWLFGLLRIRYAFPQPGRLTVKLLWLVLYDLETAEHEEKTTDTEKTEEKAKQRNKDKIKEEAEVISEKRSEEYSDTVSQTTAGNTDNTKNTKNTNNTNNTMDEDNTEESRSTDASNKEQSQKSSENHGGGDGQGTNWISEKIEKIKFTICDAYDKIKKIWENISYYVFLLQEEETHLLFSHSMRRLWRVFRNIRPRRLRVNVLFGTGAPDTTGYAFGVYSMFSPVLGSGVIVTPDFERVVLEGDFDATGTITSAVLVWHFLRVILDKKLWKFMDKLKKNREPVDSNVTETREKDTKNKNRTQRK